MVSHDQNQLNKSNPGSTRRRGQMICNHTARGYRRVHMLGSACDQATSHKVSLLAAHLFQQEIVWGITQGILFVNARSEPPVKRKLVYSQRLQAQGYALQRRRFDNHARCMESVAHQ